MIYIEHKTEITEIRFPKSISNGVSAAYLYLENHLNNYTIQVTDTSNYSNYYVFNALMSNVADGEYYAYLQDINKNILAQTIMYVGVSDEEVDYEYYEEPEVDIEYDPNSDAINPYDVEIIDTNNVVSYYRFDDGIIPEDYFNTNENIVSVRFGSGITTVGNSAFTSCSYLQRIDWGNVTTVGNYAFANLVSMETLHLPSTLKHFGEFCFQLCAFKNIIIDEGCDISESSFLFANNYALTSFILPQSMTVIPEGCFSYCRNLETIDIPNSVTRIEIDAFTRCNSLTSLTLPDSVTSIGESAFGYTALETVVIGSGLTEVGSSAFVGCENLTAITITAINAPQLDGEPFEDVAEVGVLTHPEGSDYSEWYEWLPTGWNPDAVISRFYLDDGSIETYASLEIFDSSFYGVEDIVRIEFGEGVEGIQFSTIGSLPNLTSVTFPSTLTSIGEYNFDDCSSLTEIICNAIVAPQLGDGVFDGIAEVGTLIYPEGSDYSDWYDALPEGWRPVAPVVGTVKVYFQNGTDRTDEYHSETLQTDAYSGVTTITKVEISSGFTAIGDNTFDGCQGITSLTLPNGLTSIGNYAFYNCNSLSSLTLPNTLTSIGNSAFENCYHIYDNLVIPNSVEEIGDKAFYNCDYIITLTFGQNSQCTSIGADAFHYSSNLIRIYLPSSLQSIGNGAFSNCSELHDITCSATTAPTLGSEVFYRIATSTPSYVRGTLTYPTGSDYSTWYAQLPEKFDPNYNPFPNPNPGGGGDGVDEMD